MLFKFHFSLNTHIVHTHTLAFSMFFQEKVTPINSSERKYISL